MLHLEPSTSTSKHIAIIKSFTMASDAPEKTEQSPAAQNGPADAAPPAPTVPDSRLPSRKDMSLREFLNKMDDYAPIVCSPRFASRLI